MSVHERVLQQRRANGLTQVGMAKALGIARQTYLDLESGKTEMKVNTAVELSKIFQCDLVWLITGEHQSADEKLNQVRLDLHKLAVSIGKL